METAATCRTFQPQAPKIKNLPEKISYIFTKNFLCPRMELIKCEISYTFYNPGWLLFKHKINSYTPG